MNPTVDTRVGRLQKNQGRQILSAGNCNCLKSKLKKKYPQKQNVCEVELTYMYNSMARLK
uniref:Uncharacterized protein n=1 Tax=Arion vulgaris TaxID=1028688 RepID=A0A0B7AGB8_9EUPU